MTLRAPRASDKTSRTGPILPSGVESKVEQYLKRNCRHPCAFSHSSAAKKHQSFPSLFGAEGASSRLTIKESFGASSVR
jgi:hypothetical protein